MDDIDISGICEIQLKNIFGSGNINGKTYVRLLEEKQHLQEKCRKS
jgi:hypothetical protein